MLKQIIIEECKKYGYEYFNTDEYNIMWFSNPTVKDELHLFNVEIDEDDEYVIMWLNTDDNSCYSYATSCELNDEENILKNIESWISEENLKEVEKYFLESEAE